MNCKVSEIFYYLIMIVKTNKLANENVVVLEEVLPRQILNPFQMNCDIPPLHYGIKFLKYKYIVFKYCSFYFFKTYSILFPI